MLQELKKELPEIKINRWINVAPIHCHQCLPENTLVTKLRAISKDRVFTEVMFKFTPPKLKFFFDHKIDHLPGMLEICAMRQACLALSHLIYGVPMSFITVLDHLEVKMYNYGELDKQTFAKGKLLNIYRNKYRIIIDLEGVMLQEDYPVMKMKGKLVTLHPAIVEKFRYKKVSYKEKDWVAKWISH